MFYCGFGLVDCLFVCDVICWLAVCVFGWVLVVLVRCCLGVVCVCCALGFGLIGLWVVYLVGLAGGVVCLLCLVFCCLIVRICLLVAIVV